MKYYGKRSMASALRIILDLVLIIGIVATFLIFKSTFFGEVSDVSTAQKILLSILLVVGISCVFLIVINLIKVLSSLVNSNPFIIENVRILKKISVECFIIALCYIINFFANSNIKEFEFIYVDGKGVHTDMEFIIFIFAGCFILILSKVFQQAVNYKEENDFTI